MWGWDYRKTGRGERGSKGERDEDGRKMQTSM